MTKDKIREILDLMNNLQECLLSLPDDMLLNIDPRDNQSLEEGFAFIKAYNKSLTFYSHCSSEITKQIKGHFAIDPEIDDLEEADSSNESRERVIMELDKSEAHHLSESFTYKRPYGFMLFEKAYRGVTTWKKLYLLFLEFMQKRDPALFATLPQNDKFISKRGKPLFSPDHSSLRSAEKVADGIYAEVNLSANNLRDNLHDILDLYGIDPQEMKIYLREDRDADSCLGDQE